MVADHGATVLRVCRAMLGGTDADDAWAETFLAALRAYPDLPAGANVEAWLVRIATNKAIDQARARSRRPAPVGNVPEPQADVPEEHEDLSAAVERLPDKQRMAVRLHYLAGLPYALVAEQIGGTPAAARRAAADGIATLRTRLLPTGAPR